MSTLAIVIPGYKQKFFEGTLHSLALQTNTNFNVYVGDDNSPDDLKSICDRFTHKLNITYHRFANNIGAEKLVNQWTRCVELTKNEEWIWVFSDDDLLDNNCVENFYKKLHSNDAAVDIFRFNTCIINRDNNIVYTFTNSPAWESSPDLALNILLGKRGNVMPDQIFSRRIYNLTGGFVFTRYAQGADWAASILFSKQTGIAIIEGAKVYWRNSGENISAQAKYIKNKTIEGHLEFIEWVTTHFKYLDSNTAVTYKMMLDAAATNLTRVLIGHYKGFDNAQAKMLFLFMHRVLGFSYLKAINRLLYIKKAISFKNSLPYKAVRKLKRALLFTKA